MNWTRFTIHTTTEAEDLVCAMLQDLGISGIEIVDSLPVEDGDRQGGVFEELQPDLPQDDGTSRICFYVEEGTDTGELLESVRLGLDDLRAFTDIGEGTITSDETREEDWINNWKQYFKPIPVGQKLLIRPTWEEVKDSGGRTVLDLDPGLAFGTGTHETTRLCMELLEQYVRPGMNVLDVGCGSGILSVAALLLGADKAVGVDIDELAVKTAVENAEINHVEERFTGICGNLTDQVTGTYDIVVANIVADVIIMLTKDVEQFMKPDTVYLMSGIIDTREQDVLAAVEQHFTIIDRKEEKGWVALSAKRK